MTARATTRTESGTFVTERPPDGFRARCACTWAGPWRGYDVAAAYDDAATHEAEGCES